MTHRFLRLEHGGVLVTLAALAALALAACGASQSKPDELEAILAGSASASPSVAPEGEGSPKWSDKASNKEKDEDLNDAQKTQMEIALRRGGDKAANCASVVPGSAKGEGEVKVTFNGKKGRATDVSVGPPWAGTDAEACIKRAFIGEIVVPFDGELEVPYTVHVGPKDADKADKGKTKPKDPKKK